MIVYGVRTPEFSPSQFEIYTYDSNRNLIDQNFQVSPPELDFEYTPLRIEFAGVYTFPSNEKVRSNIEVSFETQSNIPVKSRIIMTLPASSFGSLGTNVNCRVSGAFLVFDDCLVAGRSAYVTLSQELPSNTSLTLHLDNIFNPE